MNDIPGELVCFFVTQGYISMSRTARVLPPFAPAFWSSGPLKVYYVPEEDMAADHSLSSAAN